MINQVKNLVKFTLIGQVLVIVVAIGGLVTLQVPQMRRIQNTLATKEEYLRAQTQESLSVKFLAKNSSLGFNNLVADWLYLQLIQYFGDNDARRVTGYPLAPDYLEGVVKHDPRFVKAYLFGSTASSLFAGRPDRTVAIFNQGLARLSPNIPDAEYVWLYKGVDELLFIGNSQSARKSYLKASEWAKMGGNERIAMRGQEMAAFLAKNRDSRAAQASAWALLYSNARDDATRKLAIDNIIRLGGKINSTSDGAISIRLPKVDD